MGISVFRQYPAGALLVFVAVISIGLWPPTKARSAQGFAPQCALPFQGIAVTHPIDQTCGLEGKAKSLTARGQNRAKNNLCATGSPVTISLEDLLKLQAAVVVARIPFGQPNRLPPDRTRLTGLIETTSGQRIGEGSLVEFLGFLLQAHVSDPRTGETVNCKRPGNESNDIHITLADRPGARLCDGFVAEMIPHFRPSSWSVRNLNTLRGRPLRIAGHLLFDAGHQPCRQGRRVGSNPARASLWEIHPVYSAEVCSEADVQRCREGDSSLWTSLHEWAGR